jgi:prevent-host-death family protein
MISTSVSDLKARLSAFLDLVRDGEEVVVTDRGRPIARLSGIGAQALVDERTAAQVRSGRLRPPQGALSRGFLARTRPRDETGASLAALLDERDDDR